MISQKLKFISHHQINKDEKKYLRCPGIEPGSQAWEAHMITTTPATLV